MLIIKGMYRSDDSIVLNFSTGESCVIEGEDLRLLTETINVINTPSAPCVSDPEFLKKLSIVKQEKSPKTTIPTIKLSHPFKDS